MLKYKEGQNKRKDSRERTLFSSCANPFGEWLPLYGHEQLNSLALATPTSDCAGRDRWARGLAGCAGGRTGPHKDRNVIERCYCRLKDFRRIATRYDKLARNYFSALCLVAAVAFWL